MKSSKIFRILSVAVILALLVMLIPAVPALAAERVRLDPDEGEIGERIDVTGYDYDPDEPVDIYFSEDEAEDGDEIDSEVENYERVKSTYVDELGDLDTSFTVPDELTDGEDDVDVSGGTYYVYVTYEDDDEIVAYDTFTVIAGEITISPDDGPVGTEVDIDGTGFADNDDITVKYDGSTIDIESGDKDTDSDGEFSTTILIPESAAGEHTITVEDDTGSEAEDTFTVEAAMTIGSTSGVAGETLTVSGTGFGNRVEVTITFGGEEVATDETDSDGSFSVTFTVPAMAPGTYDVKAEDEDDNEDEASFTMAAQFSLGTTTGNIGTDINLSGTGFRASTTITITYDGESVATVTSSTYGEFSATFKAPVSEGGPHTIAVTDGTNTFSDTFTMESAAPPTPAPLLPKMEEKPERPILFDWGDVTDPSGVTYTLVIAKDRNFADVVLKKEGLTESKYTMTETEDEMLESTKKEEPYWWHVKAVDGASNESQWSGSGAFHVGFVFGLPDWAKYLLFALGGILLFFIGFFIGRRGGYAY